MLPRLVDGLRTMHDDAHRREFLLDIGGRLDEVSRWLVDAGLDRQVNVDYTPTFLHGGPSVGRWIVMGINPGADDQGNEHAFKRSSPKAFLAFHEQFYLVFPRLRRNARQSWWSKLYRVMRLLDGIVADPGAVPWSELHRGSSFVVQDLLPFHGRTSGTLGSLRTGLLGAVADATIEGVSTSEARGVFVFSRQGFRLFAEHERVRITRHFSLVGQTRSGAARHVQAYIARVGAVPLIAMDNEFIAQPTIPYAESIPALIEELRRDALIE